MDTLRNPAGPLPPATYWRRRALVLAVMLLVVGLMAWACARTSGGGTQPVGAVESPSPSASVDVSTVPALTPSPSGIAGSGASTGSASGSTSGSTSGSAAPSEKSAQPSPSVSRKNGHVLCDPSELRITARTDERYYPADQHPAFTMLVVSVAKSTCWVDVGAAAASFTVISGKDRIWSSADCAKAASKLRRFKSGQVWTTDARWDRDRSAAGCPGHRAAARAGYYVVEARVGDAAKNRDRAVFVLK